MVLFWSLFGLWGILGMTFTTDIDIMVYHVSTSSWHLYIEALKPKQRIEVEIENRVILACLTATSGMDSNENTTDVSTCSYLGAAS